VNSCQPGFRFHWHNYLVPYMTGSQPLLTLRDCQTNRATREATMRVFWHLLVSHHGHAGGLLACHSQQDYAESGDSGDEIFDTGESESGRENSRFFGGTSFEPPGDLVDEGSHQQPGAQENATPLRIGGLLEMWLTMLTRPVGYPGRVQGDNRRLQAAQESVSCITQRDNAHTYRATTIRMPLTSGSQHLRGMNIALPKDGEREQFSSPSSSLSRSWCCHVGMLIFFRSRR